MRVAFTADEGAFEADEYALICGVAGENQWLTFQRDAENSPEDWGVHLEYGGQANGGYGCVAACRISPELLSVDLGKQLGRLAGVTGFDVSLRFGPEVFTAVRKGLRRVFHGQVQLLTDSEGSTCDRPEQ
jgi:hypothetical protein